MRSEVVYRGILAFVVVSSSAFLVVTNVGGTAAATTAPYAEVREQAALPAEERDALAPPRNGTTVVTSHVGEAGDIVAFAPNGTVLYHDDDHDGYWDVDPSSTGDRTVVYSATDEVRNRSQCTPVGGDYCIRQTIERANLSTGETTVLYSRVDPRYHASEWHDIDPLGDSRFVVADMYADEVFVVNASTGLVTWEWSLQSHLSLTTGGQYPADWAHLNDVEVLRDGRVMVSLRNQDQVVFIDPDEGVDPAWTLGSDDRHDVLYEQHNPDYIPTVRGGPAVVIADSENNRLIEYQRTSAGNWTRTWVWKDQQLQWPRDADRLPNGHTLVTDTGGGRVAEVGRGGEVVWSVDVATAYEAERLNTGDESEGGSSARQANLTSTTVGPSGTSESTANPIVRPSEGISGLYPQTAVLGWIKSLLPNKMVNGIENGTPLWMGFYDAIAVAVAVLAGVIWLIAELWWAGIRLQNPVTRR